MRENSPHSHYQALWCLCIQGMGRRKSITRRLGGAEAQREKTRDLTQRAQRGKDAKIMISMEEVEQAVNRLEEAGYFVYGRSDQTDFERFKNGGMFLARRKDQTGGTHSKDAAAAIKDTFLVDYQNYGSTYAAYFLLGQVNIPIRTSSSLDTVITAAINYLEMRDTLPGRNLKWGSLSDDTNGIVATIYWLNQAGALAEIMSASGLQVTFADRIYTIDVRERHYMIKVSDSDKGMGASTLEDAVLSILAHQCKKSFAKED